MECKLNWIQKFTEMIFPLDRTNLNIEGAFLMKDQHLPDSIFKYREINKNTLKNLREDTVWLADPSNFNDPYDCSHTTNFQYIQKQRSSTFFELYFRENEGKLNITDNQKKIILSSPDPMNELIDILLAGEPLEKKEGMKAVLISVQEKMHADMALSGSKNIANSFKLCSFSERNDSMLMWAHYANYHQGFCIEYDLVNIPRSDFRRRFLYPTIYSDNMFDATEHMLKGVDDESFNNLHLSLAALIKAKDWEYEKEWRLVFANGIFKEEKSYEIGFPKMVYLGTKIKSEDQETIISICNERGIPFCKMKAHHSEFKLVPTTVKESEQHFFKENA